MASSRDKMSRSAIGRAALVDRHLSGPVVPLRIRDLSLKVAPIDWFSARPLYAAGRVRPPSLSSSWARFEQEGRTTWDRVRLVKAVGTGRPPQRVIVAVRRPGAVGP